MWRRARFVVPAAVVALSVGLVVAVTAGATAPPKELNTVCIDAHENVIEAADASACGRGETVLSLPQDRPLRLCADVRSGALRRGTDCTNKEHAYTVPDSGAIYVCASNVRGGTVLDRGALRRVDDPAQCDPRGETAYVTPAAPQAVDDAFSVDEDSLLDVPARGVLVNDRDLTGAPLVARLVAGVARGTLDFRNDGGFGFDPRGSFDALDAGQKATASFTYLANDGALDSFPTTATVTVVGRNDAPTAHPDAYDTDEDHVLRVAAPGVLGNDTDAESQPLTAVLVTGPARGELALNPDGSFAYDPGTAFDGLAAGHSAIVSFTYLTRDGTADSAATRVTITIEGANDVPVGRSDAYSTDENSVLRIAAPGVLGNDADADGETLKAELASAPASGTLDLAPDGSLTFDPRSAFDSLESGETGTATFTYRGVDPSGGRSAPATVTISIAGRSAPRLSDDTAATDEDTPVEFDVLANDQVFGGTITAIDSVSGRVDRLDAGHVRFAPGAPFQDLRPGEERDGLFRYTVTNDEGDATATVRIAVEGRNDAPEASPDSYEAAEDATLDRDAEHGVLGNDTDVEHDALSAVLVSPPSSGRLTLRTDGSLAFEPAGDLRDGESERVTFAYRASDGRSESATTTATILVNGVNDPPVLSDQAFTVGENSPVGTAVGTVAYSDPDDGQHHTLAIDSGNASGTFAIDEQTGAITVADSSALDAERNPSFDLIVSVRDAGGLSDTGRIHVAVADVDESPVAHDDAYVATGNTELAAGGAPPQTGAVRIDGDSVLNNDADPDGKGLSVTPASGRTAAGGHYEVDPAGAFSYIPPAGFTGSDSFPYEVGDGATTVTATVDITVERRIWYIDAGRPLPGDGTSAAPFTSLAAVGGSGTEQPDGPGDTIFLFGTGAYDGSIALESRERLVGQGVDLVVDDHTLVPRSTSLPRIQSTGAPAVTLGADNDLSGFTVRAIGAAGIAGSDFGTMTAALDAVEALGGRALDLHDGTAQADFGWLSSSASPDAALVLDHVGGNLDAASVELVDSGASAIAATDDDAAISLDGGTIRSAAGGVTASGGGGALDIGAAVSTTGGNSVAVSERAPRSDGGCSVVLRGPIDDSGQGILLEQNDAGARTCFSGPLTLSTGTAPAFVARDGGTLSVTGDANVVTTTTGTGLYLDGVAIAGDGATFRSVSTDGAEYGIRVKSLASGGGRVAVTGTGSPDTGGLIQSASTGVSIEDASGVALGGLRVTRSTGDGVVLTDASDVSIRQSAVEDSGGSGIRGQRVSGLALGANVVVQRSDEDGIELRDVLGTSSVTQATLRDNHGAAQLLVANTSAGAAAPDILRLDSLTIDGSRGNLVDVDAGAGSNLQVLVGSGNGTSSFLRDGADGVHANAHDGGRLNLSVAKVFRQNGTGDAVALETGGASAGGDSAQLTFDLSDNNSARGGSIVAPGGAGVRLTAAQGGVLRAAVRDNEIEQPGDDGVAIISSGGRVEPQVASNQITTPGCRYPGGFDSRCVKASGANACPAILAADQDIAGVSATASSGGTIEGRIQRNEVTDPLGGGVLAHVSGTASTTLELSGNRVTQTLPCDMLENPILADANGGTLHLTGGGNTLTLTDKARDGLVVDATGGSTATAMLAGDTIEGGRDGVHASAQGSSLSVDLSGLERTGGDRDAVHLHATGSSARLHAHVRDAAEAARGGIDSPARDGIALIGDDGAVVDGVVSGNEITSPGGAGVRVTGRLTEVAVESNHVTGARESAIAIDANGAAAPDTPAAELALDVAGNVVHDAGNPPAVAPTPESPFDPPPPVYDAIAVDSEQPGTAAVRGNEVTGTVGARGIAVNGLGEPLSLTVADNRVGTSDAPLTGAGAGIAVTAANVCLGMTGNASFVASGLGYELDAEGPLFGLSDYDGTGVAQWLARHGNTGSAGWSGGLWPC